MASSHAVSSVRTPSKRWHVMSTVSLPSFAGANDVRRENRIIDSDTDAIYEYPATSWLKSPSRVAAVAHHQPMPIGIQFTGVLLHVLGHLAFDGCPEHPPRSVAEQEIDRAGRDSRPELPPERLPIEASLK